MCSADAYDLINSWWNERRDAGPGSQALLPHSKGVAENWLFRKLARAYGCGGILMLSKSYVPIDLTKKVRQVLEGPNGVR